MTGVLDAPWFYWAIGVAVGFPIALVPLTELQNALRRRNSFLVRPVHLLRTYILPLGALVVSAGRRHPSFRRGDPGPRRVHGVLLRRPRPAAVGPQCDPVPGGAGRHMAQTHSDDFPRRRAFRPDRGRDRADPRLHLGRQRRRPFHCVGHLVDRARPRASELRRADHLRPPRAVRAAVPDRRLDRDPHRTGAGGRGQLARNAYRHRRRVADHAELGARRCVVHELQQTAWQPLALRGHRLLRRRSARRGLRGC